MFKKPLILLTGLGLLNANPLSVNTMKQILSFTQKAHYCEVLVNCEYNHRIGVAWFEMGEDEDGTWTYNFNYMRFDNEGRILVDMRNFKVKPTYIDKYGIDWETSIPTFNCIADERGNSWLIYSYDTDSTRAKWHIGYVGVDSVGKIIVDESIPSDKPQYILTSKPRYIVAYPADKLGFHLYWYPEGSGFRYFNLSRDEPEQLSKKFSYTKTGIELQDSSSLLIVAPNAFNKRIGPDSFEYRIISDRGEVIKEKTLEWQKYVSINWEDIDLPHFYKAFRQDKVIYFLFPYEDKIHLIMFTDKGEVVKPKKFMRGSVLSADDMSEKVKRFIKIHKGTIYYFGFDGKGNLYYWNSQKLKK